MVQSIKLTVIAAVALVCAFASTQVFVPSADAAYTDTDGDGVTDVAEEVFGSNSSAASSKPEVLDALLFLSYPMLIPACTDGRDNDGDGMSDSADTGCQDHDDDGVADATELNLGSDPADDSSFPEDSRLTQLPMDIRYAYIFATFCSDEEDNDGDGLTDGADSGCEVIDTDGDGFDDSTEKALGADWEDAGDRPEHASINPGSCSDSIDNDSDGGVDAADQGCHVAPNDDLADALEVNSLPFTQTAKAANATVEFGERVSDCSLFGDEEVRGTLWYSYTAQADTHLLIDATGSDLLSAISVWRDSAFGLQEVGCAPAFFFFSMRPRLATEVLAGETYYVQVERLVTTDVIGLGTPDLGRLSIHMEVTQPPANDNFSNAEPVQAFQAIDPFADTLAASVEPDEPQPTCQDGYTANSVWYRYTPPADTNVHIAPFFQTDFFATFAVYEGASLAALDQVACGNQLAFQAEAGHTYNIQASGFTCNSPNEPGGIASFCLDSRGGYLMFSLTTFEMPSCPAPQFSFLDPNNDGKPHDGPPAEIISTSIAFGDYVCIRLGLNGNAALDGLLAEISVDTDEDRETGWDGPGIDSCGASGLGVDEEIRWQGAATGLLAQTGGDPFAEQAYVQATSSSITFLVPAAILSETFKYRAVAFSGDGERFGFYLTDCAPNGGNITCQNGACAFSPFRNGDANCATGANAIDAAIILQYGAGLLSTLSCPDAADVDGNNVIDSRDAALVLQYAAGLLTQLPPFFFFEG